MRTSRQQVIPGLALIFRDTRKGYPYRIEIILHSKLTPLIRPLQAIDVQIPNQLSVFLKRSTAQDRMVTPMMMRASNCGQRISIPTPFRNIARMMTR